MQKARNSFTSNFKHATVEFIFILLFVNVFQKLFGAENSIVGVIFTIMMAASMIRDLTATPIRHLLLQSGVLVFDGGERLFCIKRSAADCTACKSCHVVFDPLRFLHMNIPASGISPISCLICFWCLSRPSRPAICPKGCWVCL